MAKKLFTLLFVLVLTFTLFTNPKMIEDPFPIEEKLQEFPFDSTNGYGEDYLEKSQINLITVDPGKEIFSYFGHTAIELLLPSSPSIFFDTGIFSYTDTFVQDLLKGKLFFGAYRSYGDYSRANFEKENREVITLPLNLTNEKKAGIIDFTTYHARKENHTYLYDYYFDNCATRIRDIIDKATEGELKEFGMNINEGTTFRKLTTSYMKKAWPINFTFNYLEGPSIDRPITRYEAAFIPSVLNTLVSDYQANTVTETEYPLYSSTIALTLESLTLASLIALLLYLMLQAKRKFFNRLSHIISFLLYTYLAILASVLFYMQNFSYHQVTYNNENLFIISPFIILLAVEHLINIFKLDYKSEYATLTLKLSIISASALLILKMIFFDYFAQNNFYIFAFIAPFYLIEWIRKRKKKERAIVKDESFDYL